MDSDTIKFIVDNKINRFYQNSHVLSVIPGFLHNAVISYMYILGKEKGWSFLYVFNENGPLTSRLQKKDLNHQ